MQAAGPIVVGGSGGSGTRAVMAFLHRNGVDTPRERTGAYDCIPFTEFLRRWVEPVLTATRRLDYRAEDLPEAMRSAMDADLTETLARMRSTMAGGATPPWGWKCPRTIFVLPVLAARFPELVFVHVVRDGRDMLTSKNDNQARRFYATLTGGDYAGHPARAVAETWTRLNLDVARFGEAVLGTRYVRVRYEDLCDPTPDARTALLHRLSLPTTVLEDVFRPSSRAGAWRAEDLAALRPVHQALAPGLLAFGYIDAATAAALAVDTDPPQPPSRVISGA